MESTYEEKLECCKRKHMNWLLVIFVGMIPILITGAYLCLNVTNYKVLESQSTLIFTIFGICGLICVTGMITSTYYSNEESTLMFEETFRLLDTVALKVKENKNEDKH